MSNLRTPITHNPPTIANEEGRQAEFAYTFTLCPTAGIVLCWLIGIMKSVQHHNQISSVVRHVKGSKGHLSQRINCYTSNAGTNLDSLEAVTLRGRLADSQCLGWGRRVVVVSERVMPLTRRRTLAEKVHRLPVAGRRVATMLLAYTGSIKRGR